MISLRTFFPIAAVVAFGSISCGDAACVIPPCTAPIAINISVSSSSSSRQLAGVFVQLPGGVTASCSTSAPFGCTVPGGAGTYLLEIGAEGFQSEHRTVTVTGNAAGACSCASVNTQMLAVVLVVAANPA